MKTKSYTVTLFDCFAYQSFVPGRRSVVRDEEDRIVPQRRPCHQREQLLVQQREGFLLPSNRYYSQMPRPLERSQTSKDLFACSPQVEEFLSSVQRPVCGSRQRFFPLVTTLIHISRVSRKLSKIVYWERMLYVSVPKKKIASFAR